MNRDRTSQSVAFALLAAALLPHALRAAPIVDFSTPVVTGTSQAPGVWYTDRYAPAGFTSPVTAHGRSNTLLQSISSADAMASRPSAFSSAFYNTQGRKYDLPAGTTRLFIDLYVSSDWDALNQGDTGGRVAGLWATGFDNTNNVSSFPIIEFNNVTDGFRTWDVDLGGFTPVGGFTGYDQWYQIGFTIDPATGVLNYLVNGSVVNTYNTTGGTQSLGNVILQGHNAGNSFDISWDGLTTTAVPEPGSLALLVVALTGGAGYWARRRPGI